MRLHFFTGAFLIMLCSSSATLSQTVANVMFYNTENLFDTSDNPLRNDDEFTPGSVRGWTDRRYWRKLTNISRVIAAIDEDNGPEIIGMCEVENETVMQDLTRRSVLRTLEYDYIVTDAPDTRGINVALLYKRQWFRPICHESLTVNLQPAGGGPTRDILHVSGRVISGDTLDIYVCHWPSRIGGTDESEPRRIIAAQTAMRSIREVCALRSKPYVILMGDLNEGPADYAVSRILGAVGRQEDTDLPDTALVALMNGLSPGSYRYEGEWEFYDQFVVSASLLNGSGRMAVDNVRIGTFSFVLEEDDEYGGRKPRRTYNGYRYQGGFSDHLPVALDICFKNDGRAGL